MPVDCFCLLGLGFSTFSFADCIYLYYIALLALEGVFSMVFNLLPQVDGWDLYLRIGSVHSPLDSHMFRTRFAFF